MGDGFAGQVIALSFVSRKSTQRNGFLDRCFSVPEKPVVSPICVQRWTTLSIKTERPIFSGMVF